MPRYTILTQSEILDKVGPDALRLGLLMGTEDDPREEEQQEVLSFHHLTFMEFAAGKYISTKSRVSLFVGWSSFSLETISTSNV